MGSTVDEGMLIRRMDLRRTPKPSDDSPARLVILVEHADGTDYTVSVGTLELRPSGARQRPAVQPRPTMEKEETS